MTEYKVQQAALLCNTIHFSITFLWPCNRLLVMSVKRGADFIKTIADYCVKNGGHDAITRAFKVTSGGNGRCIGEFTVAKEHLNPLGGLHGGYTATLIDNVTTYALMTTDSNGGMSTDLHVSYFKGAREGDEIIVDAKTLSVGRKLAFIECVLKKKSDGSIVAKGGQTKYVESKEE